MAEIKIPLPTNEQMEELIDNQGMPIAKGRVISDGYIVCYVRDDKYYAKKRNERVIYKSTNGIDWTPIYTHDTLTLHTVHKTTTGITIAIFGGKFNSNTWEMYRSIDDVTFAKVKDNIYGTWETTGLDSNGNTIVYSEYAAVSNGTTLNVYKSTNGGVDWTTVISRVTASGGFSHFHTAQYLNKHVWMVTAGDGNVEWLVSVNNATSFNTFVLTTDERYRTLGVSLVGLNSGEANIYWASDGAWGNEGVYMIRLTNTSHYFEKKDYYLEKVFSLPSTSYGFSMQGNVMIATSFITTPYANYRKSKIYVSHDTGVTWKLLKSFEVDKDIYADSGIHKLSPIFDNGKCYATVLNSFGDESYEFSYEINLEETNTQLFTNNTIGRSNEYVLFPRAIYSEVNNDIIVSPPKWAKGMIVYARVYGLTGNGTPTLKLQTNHQFNIAIGRFPSVETTVTTANHTTAHYWYPSVSQGDADYRDMKVALCGLPLINRLRITLNITGATFATGEGIDCECQVVWLP